MAAEETDAQDEMQQAAGVEDADREEQAAEAPVAAEDDDVIEMEISDDDIVRYLEDEDGNRIGFVVMEDGEEAEYLYVEDPEPVEQKPQASKDDEYDLGITREGVNEATKDVNAIYKDGIQVAAELKGAFDDIKEALDFKSFLK